MPSVIKLGEKLRRSVFFVCGLQYWLADAVVIISASAWGLMLPMTFMSQAFFELKF